MMCFFVKRNLHTERIVFGPSSFLLGGGELLRKNELPSEVIFIHGGSRHGSCSTLFRTSVH